MTSDIGYGDFKTNDLYVQEGQYENITFTDLVVKNPMISFNSEGFVGCIKVNSETRQLEFEGDIDASVKVFFESYWGKVMAEYGLSISKNDDAKCWNCQKQTELHDFWTFGGKLKQRYECDCGFCGPWIATEVTP